MTKVIKIVSYNGSFGEGKSYGLMTSREMILSADSMDAYVSLFGLNDQNIALIEQECGVTTALRGNKLVIQGEEDRLDLPEQVIETLLSMIRRHEYVDRVRIRYVIAMIREGKKEQIEETLKNVIAVTHRGKQITCKTIGQQQYVNAIRQLPPLRAFREDPHA